MHARFDRRISQLTFFANAVSARVLGIAAPAAPAARSRRQAGRGNAGGNVSASTTASSMSVSVI